MASKADIIWETLEHPYFEKKSDWYWIVGIVGATAAFLSVLFANVLLAIIFALGTVALIIHGSHKPEIIEIKLRQSGISMGEQFFPYTELKSFSIFEEGEVPTLTVLPKSGLSTHTTITIEDTDPDVVRDFLLDHIDEIYHEQPWSESISHYLGF